MRKTRNKEYFAPPLWKVLHKMKSQVYQVQKDADQLHTDMQVYLGEIKECVAVIAERCIQPEMSDERRQIYYYFRDAIDGEDWTP